MSSLYEEVIVSFKKYYKQTTKWVKTNFNNWNIKFYSYKMSSPIGLHKPRATIAEPNKKVSLKDQIIEARERKKSVTFKENNSRISFMLLQKGVVATPKINLFSPSEGI